VFGACGERDRGKRPMMGEIVSLHADIVILTNEDPYHEDPERILDEIEVGVKGKITEKTFFRIFDRREAIRKALSLLSQDDILLVTGKGAEETMALGDERIPWNDRKVIAEELEKIAE
jgi:UDP-N-acetylmuramoyl-L-alanyl-D-glutamate--2,6-diaminopimelate ligase